MKAYRLEGLNKDFYYFVQHLKAHGRNPTAVVKALERQFGKRRHATGTLYKLNGLFPQRGIEQSLWSEAFQPILPTYIHHSSALELIHENIFDPASRHLLIISPNGAACTILFETVPKGETFSRPIVQSTVTICHNFYFHHPIN